MIGLDERQCLGGGRSGQAFMPIIYQNRFREDANLLLVLHHQNNGHGNPLRYVERHNQQGRA